ncbi:MAG: PAS domain S-box protein [Campylobacterales bacterium]|nr:PAS domain S-box protein [Campylobacterales bacterium]
MNTKNIPAQIEKSLGQLSLLALENSFNAVVITTGDVKNPIFVYVNAAFCAMTGYSRKDILGKNPKILQGSETDFNEIARLKECLNTGKHFHGATVNYKKDGSAYDVEWNISPIFDDEGKINYFVSFQKDITPQKELQRRNEELLIYQSKLASIGELMNSIAHQWKQPLNAISLAAQYMQMSLARNLDKTKLEEKISGIIRQTEFMNTTVTSFQNFLRPADLNTSFSPLRAINEILTLLKDDLTVNRIKVSCALETADISIKGSENEFKQVLLNLLTNARDAFNANNSGTEREIKISTLSKKGHLEIKITDNAGGISSSPIDKVFENSFSTKADKGTGIGLYIVKKILKRMKGDIAVENVGNGAQFTIVLPAYRE